VFSVRHIVATFSLLLFAGVSHAALITYTIEGDLSTIYPDDLNVQGAHFIRQVTYDTDSSPTLDSPGGGVVFREYESVADQIQIIDRPDGADDVFLDLQLDDGPTTIWFEDNYEAGFDEFTIEQRYMNAGLFSSVWEDLGVGVVTIGQVSGYMLDGGEIDFLGSGNSIFPDIVNDGDLIDGSFRDANYRFITSDRAVDDIDPWLSDTDATELTVSNFSMSSTVVPIPAAVWLFGSALAGLSLLKRKQIV
jgi:hypothetical protein